MNLLKYYDGLLTVLRSVIRYVIIVMASVIFIIALVTVFSRYLFDSVISWSEEVPRYLLVWIGFLGSAMAVDSKEHIGFDFLFNKFSPNIRLVLSLLLNLGIAFLGYIMLVYGIEFVKQFGADWMESIPFSNKWFYSSLPISGGLILLFVARQEVDLVKELLRKIKVKSI
jgi:TRAP-type C4-dicarboxylate transport system permease small subunit